MPSTTGAIISATQTLNKKFIPAARMANLYGGIVKSISIKKGNAEHSLLT